VRKRHVGALAACVLLLLVVVSCGGDDDDGDKAAPKGSASTAPKNTTELPDVDQHFKASGPLTASAPGVTPKTIKLGYITSQTGIAASSFKGGDAGARARIELQNDQGGINGRKIELVTADDGGIGPLAAAKDLVENEKVFGVVDISAFVVSAAPYLNEQGIPVTGGAFDGPEWGQEPYTNMFTFGPPQYTPFDGKFYVYDNLPKFMKSQGVTKLATLGYSISQSSTQNLKSALQAAEPYDIEDCYGNYAVEFGQTSFPTESLAIQNAGCDGVLSAMVDSSDVGLSAGLKQAGIDAKQFYYTGFSQSVLDDEEASAALDGAYFPAAPNWVDPPPGVQKMVNALRKYAPSVKGIPSLGLWESYFATDLMIRGLEAAGENPTREAFIENLRKVDNYTGHGLYDDAPLDFTHFGTVDMFPKEACTDFVQLKDGEYVTAAKDVCGKLVETSS
jgi:branched-chain amino acid transport system substrate-binding protein